MSARQSGSAPLKPARTQRGLYLITPDQSDTARLLEQTRQALEAGIAWLQYRNKKADSALRRTQAQALHALCAPYRVPLIINDDVMLARQLGAAGVHLGEADGDLAAARACLGPEALIGASCYDDLARARQAVAAGADYIAFGAFFPSPSKPASRRASVDLLRAAADLGVPRVAIGGIRPDNGRPLIAAGADLLAVISGVYAAADVAAAVNAYHSCFTTLP